MHRPLICLSVTLILLSCQNRTEQSATGTRPPGQPSGTAGTAQPQNMANAKLRQVVPLTAVNPVGQSFVGAPGPAGTVTVEKQSFKKGEPVFVTITIRDRLPGTRLTARWFDKAGKKIAEDSKQVKEEKSATFQWKGKALKPGDYKVSTFWGAEPAGDHLFTITK